MSKYERYTSKDGATLTMSQWGGSPAELELYRKLAELEDKIENGTLVKLPKYKLNQKVYVLPLNNSIGTIDGYDLFKHKYLVYIECGDEFGKLGFGNEWFTEQELSATKPKPKQS